MTACDMGVTFYVARHQKTAMSGGLDAWARRDSNPQPRDYESLALTVELQARITIVRAAAVRSNVGRKTISSNVGT